MLARPGPGAAFLLAVVALGVLAVSDFTLIGASSRTGYDYGDFFANEDRAVLARSVVMKPGDRLILWPELGGGGWPTLARYELFVVNGGDRLALLDGEAPRATYVHVGNMTTQGCCASNWIAWTRPDDDFARREGRERVATGPGIEVDRRDLVLSGTDQPDRIDLVWVFEYGPNVTVPEDPDAQRRFEDLLGERVTQDRLGSGPLAPGKATVLQAKVVQLQPLYYAGMAGAAVVAAGAAILWVARLQRARVDEAEAEATGTESLLRLHHAAGAFLASLRDILVGSLLVVLLVALHVGLAAQPFPVFELVERAQIAPGLRAVFWGSLLVTYAAFAAAWLYAVWHVQRALWRWRRRAKEAPLDLGELPSES